MFLTLSDLTDVALFSKLMSNFGEYIAIIANSINGYNCENKTQVVYNWNDPLTSHTHIFPWLS